MKTLKKIFTAFLLLCATALPAAAVSPEESQKVIPDSVPAGGSYIWIPDSLQRAVRSVMEGRSRIVRDYTKIDTNEKVIIKGDTVNLVLRQENLGRYDRGLFNFLFIPKGQWQFSLTASYGEFNSKDLQVFDLLTDFDFGGHMFSIKPAISYFIRNNMSVGIRFAYTGSKADVGAFAMDIDEDLNLNIKDIFYRNEEYSADLIYSQYIGLSPRSRFGIFNEVALSLASGNGDFRRPYNGEPKNTHTTYMQARLTFSPGVCVFIMKNVSFNVSFGVFGFYLRNVKQTSEGKEIGNRFTSGANFRFNIFNINFGIGVHI